jgi:membrane protease YdiL (CAAX protease family)
MISYVKKNLSIIYIVIVYVLIFLQYPAYIAITKLVLHNVATPAIQPSYLLLWGLVRVLIVIPLLFTLIAREEVNEEEIYLGFGNYRKVISITFWGTFAFTILGMLLYPWFIRTTTLTLLTFVEYLPIFLLYAITNAFIEETFFRGIALYFLSDRSKFWIANLTQASFFALIHFISPMTNNPWPFVVLTFFLGLFWGVLTRKTKSLIPAIALHVIADIFVAISLF